MPIPVKCDCGKQVAAPDKLAGKRVKCPGCGLPLQVPAAAKTAAGEKITVQCACGQVLGAPSHLAGKKVKCPGCQQPLQIPAGSAGAAAQAASPVADDKIHTQCKCGQSFAAPAKLAGKAVRCPACQEAVRIPGASPAAAAAATEVEEPSMQDSRGLDELGGGTIGSLLDEVGFQRSAAANRCPECKEDLTEDAVICIYCGYNLETGKQLTTEFVGRREARSKGTSIAPEGLSAGGSGGQRGGHVPKPISNAAGLLMFLGGLCIFGLVAALIAYFAGD